MSERGAFVTEYIYCDKCFNAVKSVLLSSEKYLMSIEIPHWNGVDKPLPIIAGKIGGLYSGEELDTFRYKIIPKIELTICHEIRIAVIAEQDEEIFKISPNKAIHPDTKEPCSFCDRAFEHAYNFCPYCGRNLRR